MDGFPPTIGIVHDLVKLLAREKACTSWPYHTNNERNKQTTFIVSLLCERTRIKTEKNHLVSSPPVPKTELYWQFTEQNIQLSPLETSFVFGATCAI